MTSKSSRSSSLYPVVTTIAGVGRRGFIDGTLNEAYLDTPFELLPYTDGTSYILVDNKNNSLRTIDLHEGTVRTIPSHSFLGPRSPVLIDNGTAMVICDSGHNKLRLIQFASPDSFVTEDDKVIEDYVIAGTGRSGFHDGIANNATFNNPSGLCVITDGSILVCDTNNHAIRRLAARPGKAGLYVTTIIGHHGPGFTDGNTNKASLKYPTALCIDKHGTVFICDTGNHSIRILHPPHDGDMGNMNGYLLTTLSGIGIPGFLDHDTSLYSLFRELGGITYDNYTNNILITDTGNNAIRCLSHSSSSSSSNFNLYTLSSKGIIEPVPIGVPLSIDRAICILDSIKISSTLAEQKQSRTVVVSPVLYPSIIDNPIFFSTLQTIGRDYTDNNGSKNINIPMDILTHPDPIAVADVYRRYNYVSTVAGAPPIVIETMIQQLSNNNRFITDTSKDTSASILSNEELTNLAPDAVPAVKTIANKVTQFNYNTAQISVLNGLKRYTDGSCFQSRLRRPIGITLLPNGKGSALFTDSSNHLVRLLVSEDALLNPPDCLRPFLDSSLVSIGTATLSLLKSKSLQTTRSTQPKVDNKLRYENITENNPSMASTKDRRSSVSSTSSGMRDFVATAGTTIGSSSGTAKVHSSTSKESHAVPVGKSIHTDISNVHSITIGSSSNTASTTVPVSMDIPSSLPPKSIALVPTVVNNHNQHHHSTIQASLTSNHHHYSLATDSSIRHVTLPGEAHVDQQLRIEIDRRLSPSKPSKAEISDSVVSSPVSILHQSSTRENNKNNKDNTLHNSSYIMHHKGTGKLQNIQIGKYTNGIPPSSSNPSLLHGNTATMIDKQIAHTVDPVGVGLLAAAALAVPTNVSSEVEILAHDPHSLLQASVHLLSETTTNDTQRQPRRKSHVVIAPPSVPVASTIKALAKPSLQLLAKDTAPAHTQTGTINNKTLSFRPIGWKFEDEVATDRKYGLVFSSEVLSSRDAVALEEHNTAGYVIKSLLLNDEKTHQHHTTVASRALLNARYARHTSSSASYYRTNGQTVVRNAPAFVNVNRVVQRTVHDLKIKATENMTVPAATNKVGNSLTTERSNMTGNLQQQPQETIPSESPTTADASKIIAAALSPSKPKKLIPSNEGFSNVLDYNQDMKLPRESQYGISVSNAKNGQKSVNPGKK